MRLDPPVSHCAWTVARTTIDPGPRRTASVSRMVSLLASAAVVGCSDFAGPALPTANDWVAFVSDRAGAFGASGDAMNDVYLARADGSALQRVSAVSGSYDIHAALPDGRTLLVQDLKPLCSRLLLMPVGGSDAPRDVTPAGCHRTFLPLLSPDRRLIALTTRDAIHVVNANWTGARVVSSAIPPATSPCGSSPTNVSLFPRGWVSSSRLIVERFVCGGGSTYYELGADGSGATEVPASELDRHRSPDGTRVAFVEHSTVPNELNSLVVARADGSDRRVVARGVQLRSEHGEVWSADGAWLRFMGPDAQLRLLDVVRGTTSAPPPDVAFRGWIPGRAAYLGTQGTSPTTGRDANYAVVIVPTAGGAPTRVTDGRFRDFDPVWMIGP